jgi:hypothetical protein
MPYKDMKEKKVLKRVGPWSYARISMILSAFFGFVFAAINALMIIFAGNLVSQAGTIPPTTAEIIVTLLLSPVFFGIFGLLFGFFFAWLYNSFARWIGGVVVEIE